MNVLFASENLQLGGLALIELWRQSQAYDFDIVGVWSSKPRKSWPSLGKASFESLIGAVSVQLPEHSADEGATFDGTYIADFSQLAEELGIRYHHIPDMKSPAVLTAVRALKVEVGLICGHGQIFPEALVEHSASEGWLNFHPSLLPWNRGPYPGFWQLRAGDEWSGVTLTRMTMRIDAGPMIAQDRFEMRPNMGFRDLVAKQAASSASLVREALIPWYQGEIEEVPQPQEKEGFYEPKPGAQDFAITPEMTLGAITSFVNGMRGVAQVFVVHEGRQVFQIDGIVGSAPLSGENPVGHSEKIAFDRVRYVAVDGEIDFVVSPFGV